MSLKIYRDLEQGSSEWTEARRGIITASNVHKLITTKTLKPANNDTSRATIREVAAERISGRVEDTGMSWAMQRGLDDEPYARDAYAAYKGVEVDEVGFMVRNFGDFNIGYSPDGMVDAEGLVEIKSRSPKIHVQHVLDDEVPAANMAQLQVGLLVSGREWIDYISYSGGLALWIKRVHPIPAWQAVIQKVVHDAEYAIQGLIQQYHQATKGLPVMEYIDHFEEPELIL